MPTFAFSGGANASPGWGQQDRIRYTGTWVAEESWSISFTSTEGDFTVGQGNISGKTPTCGLVFGDRAYIGLSNEFACSQPGDLTKWEEQDAGAGLFPVSSQYGNVDTVTAFDVFQGKLAVFLTNSIQIWTVDANPALFVRNQILNNTGTKSPESVKAIGDLDIYYLDTVGVRSIQTREQVLNAFPDDVGLPIDTTVQAKLATCTELQIAQACAVVDPKLRHYWLFIKDLIYVLARYRTSKIEAWTTFNAKATTSEIGEIVDFVPLKFVVDQETIYALGADNFLYLYSPQLTSIGTPIVVELPWLDLGLPSTYKEFLGFDFVYSGLINIYARTDPQASTWTLVGTRSGGTTSAYDVGHIPFQGVGTHIKIKVESALGSSFSLSQLTVLYNLANKK